MIIVFSDFATLYQTDLKDAYLPDAKKNVVEMMHLFDSMKSFFFFFLSVVSGKFFFLNFLLQL